MYLNVQAFTLALLTTFLASTLALVPTSSGYRRHPSGSGDTTLHIQDALDLQDITDCSNKTHRWTSSNKTCLDDSAEPLPSPPRPLVTGLAAILPRDLLCGTNQTVCWVVNCCQPWETCGPLHLGCEVSMSTIYSTTTTSMFSTITDLVVPSDANLDWTTVTVTSTTTLTSFRLVTTIGAGFDTEVVTRTSTTTTIILSASTPPPVTTTSTITHFVGATPPPEPEKLFKRHLPLAPLPRRQLSASYTTVTVYITQFFTIAATSTLSGQSVLQQTSTVTVEDYITMDQTRYQTHLAFTTLTYMITSTVSSWAYGAVETPTKVIWSIVTVEEDDPENSSSSTVAGVVPTTGTGGFSTAPTPTDDSNSTGGGGGGLAPGEVAGLVVGLLLLLIMIAMVAVVFICLRRKRQREREREEELEATPSPPLAPGMADISQPSFIIGHGDRPESPVSPLSLTFTTGTAAMVAIPSGTEHKGAVASSSRHNRKGSVVSIAPVPEEDEDEDEITPVTRVESRGTGGRRSTDSGRSWGRGYGGRGGFYTAGRLGLAHDRGRGAGVEDEPVIQSTISSERLVPPHERGGFHF